MPPPFIALRAAAAEDAEFLLAVYSSTRAEELALTGWSAERRDDFCRSQYAAQDAYYRSHYPTAQFSVIEGAGVAVGRLYVDRWEDEIRIMDIALLPGHRGAGLGTHLLRELIGESTASGKVLSIHVERFNRALQLYERLGFKLAEDKGVYLLMEWRPPPS